MQYRRLPTDGLVNARDLGGYPLPGGGATRYNRFVRCEAPRALTERDLELIRALGITLSVDFRGDVEVERHPSCLEGLGWLEYRRCPTFNAQVAFATRRREPGKPAADAFVNWGEKYVEMADDCCDWAGETLRVMAASSSGGVIYNCTTGKDRTGMITALLLGLAGVSRDDIVADYCVSEIYLTEIYKEMLGEYLKRWPDETVSLDSPFFRTEPKTMRALLAHFDDKYGGVEGYVKACGVSDGDIAELRRRLCE